MLPPNGQSWAALDNEMSGQAHHALDRSGAPSCYVAPFEHRPFTQDPMEDVILLFGCLVPRSLATAVAFSLEDPELLDLIMADRLTFDRQPDSPGQVYEIWGEILPYETLIDAGLQEVDFENDDLPLAA